MTLTPEFTLATAEGQRELIDALAARGIQSVCTNEDGLSIIEVVLVPADGKEALSVIAASLETSCEIGLGGLRTKNGEVLECGSAEFLRAPTLDVAVAAFETFLASKDVFIRQFRAGCYDC